MSHLVTGKRQPKSLSRVPHAMPHCPLPQHIKCRERHFQRVCCTAVMLKVLWRQRTREFGIQPCAHPALHVSTQQSHREHQQVHPEVPSHILQGALPTQQPWCGILILNIHWYPTPILPSLIPTLVAKARKLKNYISQTLLQLGYMM